MFRFQSLASISATSTSRGIAGHVQLVAVDVLDLLDVLRPQRVLVLPLGVLGVGVDEEDLVAQAVRLVARQHQDGGRDARAVEELGRQADDGLDHAAVVGQQPLADLLLLAAAEEHAVGHHHRHLARGLEAGQHVLHEHQVGLLARLRRKAVLEALRPLHGGAVVVLGEGRVGDHPVELEQVPVVAR